MGGRVICSSQSIAAGTQRSWGDNSRNKKAGRCHFTPPHPSINNGLSAGTKNILTLVTYLGVTCLHQALPLCASGDLPAQSPALESQCCGPLPQKTRANPANTSPDLCVLWDLSSGSSWGKCHFARRSLHTLLSTIGKESHCKQLD